MEKLFIFLKGIIIGFVSLAIPGVSASTIAILLGTYYAMIEAISSIFKCFKKSISFLIFLALGYGVGSLIGANLISFIFDEFPFVVVMTILGFIIGTLPSMIKSLKSEFKRFSNILIMAAVFVLVIAFSFLTASEKQITLNINMPLKDYILWMFVGFITSGTLVVPGLDFAIVLLSFGYYESFLKLLSFTDIKIFIDNMIVLSTYLVAYGLGSFLIAKLIKKIIVNHKMKMDFAILGFVLVSPSILIKQSIFQNDYFKNNTLPFSQIVFGIFLFIIAFSLVFIVHKINENDPNDTRIEAMKKRNMLRFYFTIAIQFPLAIYYLCKMKKMVKKNQGTFEERYAIIENLVKRINWGGNIHVKVVGDENLSKNPALYVINHQGRYDGIAVLTALKDYPCSFVAEKSRINYPFYKETFELLHGEWLDKNNIREQVKVINNIGQRLSNGTSFLVFIEGTYGNNGNNLQEFKKGTLHSAYQSHCLVTPIVLYDTYKVFSISSLKSISPEVHILKPIEYDTYKNLSKKEFADLLKEQMQDEINKINLQKEIKTERKEETNEVHTI